MARVEGFPGHPVDALSEQEQEQMLHERFLRAKQEGLMLAKQRDEAANAEALQLAERVLAQKAEDPCDKVQQLIPTWVTEEEYKEYGYPEVDKKFKDREWHRRQMELDSTDPRHNPNLNLDPNNPEFWYNAARKPFNKVLLKSEAHWQSRREVWMKQSERVQLMNQRRQLISDMLEDCSNEVKRTLTPVMKYTITMTILDNIYERAIEQKKDFRKAIEEKDNFDSLRNIRDRVDSGGPQEAETMMLEYEARYRALASKLQTEKLEQERKDRRVADVQTLASVLNWGQKCKKDGLLEWEQGNWADAYASWKQADETLRRFKASDENDQKVVVDLHGAVLKNLSQVCMKLEYWTEAVEAAEAATELNPEDHKAWFRKACALEGLGKLDEAEECLRKIDECSVGRPDRMRINKDTQARRERIQGIREREQAALKKTLGKALEKGIFSEERAPKAIEDDKPDVIRKRPKPGPLGVFQDSMRKHLTRDGAEDLLIDLRDAYRDSTFQQQVLKLARDVRMDKKEFLTNLKKVALPLQRPILERWGFEPSERGVLEMQRAVQDFTWGKRADPIVKRRADETTMALYGCMYDILTRPDSDVPDRPPQLQVRLHTGSPDRGDESD